MTKHKVSSDRSNCQPARNPSKFALKVLTKLNERGPVHRLACGGAMVAGKKVPSVLIDELLAQDLLCKHTDGAIGITLPGQKLLTRRLTQIQTQSSGEPSAFAKQHQLPARTVRRIEGKVRTLDVNLAETALGWLSRRRGKDGAPLVNEQQMYAAERLRSEFERAGLRQRVTASYDGLPVSRRRHATDRVEAVECVLDCRRRFDAAVGAMGPGLSDIVVRICCHLEGLEIAEKDMNWPARSGKIVLLLGLDRLVSHYDKLDYGSRGDSGGYGHRGRRSS